MPSPSVPGSQAARKASASSGSQNQRPSGNKDDNDRHARRFHLIDGGDVFGSEAEIRAVALAFGVRLFANHYEPDVGAGSAGSIGGEGHLARARLS